MFQDLASDWESELDPAQTDTYLSPKEDCESLDLIDSDFKNHAGKIIIISLFYFATMDILI